MTASLHHLHLQLLCDQVTRRVRAEERTPPSEGRRVAAEEEEAVCWVRQQQVRLPRAAAVYCWSCRRGVAEGRGWTAWLEGGAFLGLEV